MQIQLSSTNAWAEAKWDVRDLIKDWVQLQQCSSVWAGACAKVTQFEAGLLVDSAQAVIGIGTHDGYYTIIKHLLTVEPAHDLSPCQICSCSMLTAVFFSMQKATVCDQNP